MLEVEHVDGISGHEVIPVLAKCMVEVGQYGAYDPSIHWEQSAFYVHSAGDIIAALSYHKLQDKSAYWIDAVYVETDRRRDGIYRAMFDALVARAKENGVREVRGAVAWENHPMRAVALAVGRTPIGVTYRYEVK